jgi:hypothetical protein
MLHVANGEEALSALRAAGSDRWVGGVLQGLSCFRRDGMRIVPP